MQYERVRVGGYFFPPFSLGLLLPGAWAGLPEGLCPGGKFEFEGAMRSSSLRTWNRLGSFLLGVFMYRLLVVRDKGYNPTNPAATTQRMSVAAALPAAYETISPLVSGLLLISVRAAVNFGTNTSSQRSGFIPIPNAGCWS